MPEVRAEAKPQILCELSTRMRDVAAKGHSHAAQLRALAGQVERALTNAKGDRTDATFVRYYTTADDYFRMVR